MFRIWRGRGHPGLSSLLLSPTHPLPLPLSPSLPLALSFPRAPFSLSPVRLISPAQTEPPAASHERQERPGGGIFYEGMKKLSQQWFPGTLSGGASPGTEWEEAMRRADTLVSPHRKKEKGEKSLDPRSLVAADLSFLTQNVHTLIQTNHPVLKTATAYYFEQGGKHFRPLIVLLISMATSKCLGLGATPVLGNQKRLAEITEMIHTASLLHDDVIDTADTRRSKPSANIAFGNKMAVLAGDFLLAKASIALAQLQNLQVVELLATVIANLVEGEVLQMKTESKNLLNFDYYIEKTYLKTASLIAKSCQAAAILAGQKEEIAQIAYQYGRNLGIAFQLVDDLLDFTGTSEELGKPAAADLELGLVTAPVLFAIEENPDLLPLVQRQFQQKGDPQAAKQMVLQTKAIEKTQQMAIGYCQLAIDSISKLPESEARDCLIALTEKVVKRSR